MRPPWVHTLTGKPELDSDPLAMCGGKHLMHILDACREDEQTANRRLDAQARTDSEVAIHLVGDPCLGTHDILSMLREVEYGGIQEHLVGVGVAVKRPGCPPRRLSGPRLSLLLVRIAALPSDDVGAVETQ